MTAVNLDTLLDAAVDGQDWSSVAELMLAHPVSMCFPDRLVDFCGRFVFGEHKPNEREIDTLKKLLDLFEKMRAEVCHG